MKKKVLAAVLGLTLVAGTIGISVSHVAAEPETDQLEAEETTEEIPAEEETEEPEVIEAEESEEAETEETESVSEIQEEETAEITGMKVILENALPQDVISVEICGFASEAYSENLLLNNSLLEAGGEITIGIPEEIQEPEMNLYNVRVTFQDGTVTEIPFVLLLEDVTGTLHEENGTILIHVRDKRLEAAEEEISETELRQRDAEASQVMAEILSAEIENN